MKLSRKDFDALPKAEQRVLIAKDVIAQLRSRKIAASSGVYLDSQAINDAAPTRQVSRVIRQKPCRGCGIGALFICAVQRHNDLTKGDLFDLGDNIENSVDLSGKELGKYLSHWFTRSQLKEVEVAFEQWDSYGDDYLSEWDGLNSSARLTAIAENIVKNKGRFVGSQIKQEFA